MKTYFVFTCLFALAMEAGLFIYYYRLMKSAVSEFQRLYYLDSVKMFGGLFVMTVLMMLFFIFIL